MSKPAANNMMKYDDVYLRATRYILSREIGGLENIHSELMDGIHFFLMVIKKCYDIHCTVYTRVHE